MAPRLPGNLDHPGQQVAALASSQAMIMVRAVRASKVLFCLNVCEIRTHPFQGTNRRENRQLDTRTHTTAREHTQLTKSIRDTVTRGTLPYYL